jgi:hypothetical protein
MKINQENSQPRRPTVAAAAAFSAESLAFVIALVIEGQELGKDYSKLARMNIFTPEQAADILETITGKQMDHGTTAEALTVLKERQQRLRREKRQLLDRMETINEDQYANMDSTLAQLNHDIQDTKTRIEQYNMQLKATN